MCSINEETRNEIFDGSQNLCHIRMLNASPDTPFVDISINGVSTIKKLGYKGITKYYAAESGVFEICVSAPDSSGGKKITEKIELIPGGIYTLAISNNGISLIYDCRKCADRDNANIRFINLSSNDTVYNISVNDLQTIESLEHSEKSSYEKVKPGMCGLKIYDSSDKSLKVAYPQMPISAGKFYSCYILSGKGEEKQLQLVLQLEGATFIR